MNSKRQTIWLVSMLSLMVVLSAYYLFTEDVNNLQITSAGASDTKGTAGNEIIVNTNDLNGKQTEADTKKDGNTSAAATPDTKQPAANPLKPEQKSSSIKTETGTDAKSQPITDAKSSSSSAAKTNEQMSSSDAKVLQQITAQAKAKSGSDYFTNLGLKRNEDLAKQSEKWLTILSDPKQNADAAANAEAELRKIQDNEAKVTNLEEALMKEYPQAVITEETSKWKVTVQSNNLDKSQAVNIVEQVMNEMNVGPEKIVVQYLP
jgi:stage III sporulation protein AH